MPLRTLKATYEKRILQLKDILNNEKMDNKRKSEIRGAISEIESLLKTIENLRQQEIEENSKLESKGIGRKKHGFDIIEKLSEKVNVKFNNSRTRDNLINIFVRKCESRTKYEYFADQAKKEGMIHLSHVFQEVANNEKEHGRLILNYLNFIRETPENIKETTDIEHYFHNILYPEFEKMAIQEGFKELSQFFNDLSQVDAEHEKIFLRLMKRINEKRIFSSENPVKWKCRNCGYVTENKDAPKKCQICKSSQAFFEILKEN